MKNFSWLLNRNVLGALCATPLLFASSSAFADEAAPAAVEAAPAAAVEAAAPAAPAEPAPDFTLSFNLGLYSEYIFRGVRLSDGPALQGGIDLGHSSGFYVGTWWSNIDKNYTGHDDSRDPGLDGSGGNHLETDWYLGYAHTFANGFGVNVLGNYYYYPDRQDSLAATGGKGGNKQDSFEASIALSYKWLTYTYFNVLTDYYGTSADFTKNGKEDTSNATYHELKVSYALPIGDLNFVGKVGYQHVPNTLGSQSDFSIGLNRNFSIPSAGKPIEGFNAGAYYTGTFNVKDEAYYFNTKGDDVNEDRIWFFVKRTW
jgi:uncharacterized protein (TIGR02001 family)